MLQNATGTEMTHIPFSGAAPALQALVGSQVDLFIDNIASSLPLHNAGNLKILALGAARRAAELPNTPTLAESGLPDLDLSTWFGLFAPAKTSSEIVVKLTRAVNEILALPDVHARLAAIGIETVGGTPEALANFLAADRTRWEKAIAAANFPAR